VVTSWIDNLRRLPRGFFAGSAVSAAITQSEVVRPHTTVTGPADETVDDPVLASLFQHANRLTKLSLWMENKRRN
jgi:hypothetical protein